MGARANAFKKAGQWIYTVRKCGGLDAEKNRAFKVEGKNPKGLTSKSKPERHVWSVDVRRLFN